MSGLLSIDEQVKAMEAAWPRFRVIDRDGATAVWEGELHALFRRFTVCVLYRAPYAVELLKSGRLQPTVFIVDPPLRPRGGDPMGQLPHVYYFGPGKLDVFLCMFDPEADEWSPTMSLAETTVPWTVDWLASYEGWRATGEWTGGGRHVERPMNSGVPR